MSIVLQAPRNSLCTHVYENAIDISVVRVQVVRHAHSPWNISLRHKSEWKSYVRITRLWKGERLKSSLIFHVRSIFCCPVITRNRNETRNQTLLPCDNYNIVLKYVFWLSDVLFKFDILRINLTLGMTINGNMSNGGKLRIFIILQIWTNFFFVSSKQQFIFQGDCWN